MFLECDAIHHDVVQVCNNETVEERLENLVNEGAKRGWCICKAKRHNMELERAILGYVHCFLLVSLGYAHLIVHEL